MYKLKIKIKLFAVKLMNPFHFREKMPINATVAFVTYV